MERHAIRIRGIVQGVGFRPFVYGLAVRHGLVGFVRNCNGAVLVEVEGKTAALAEFLAALRCAAPAAALVEDVRLEVRPCLGETEFHIVESESAADGTIFVSPDLATCDECLAECFDPANRRYRHPFVNCTNCGPRLTVVTGVPYDRQRTTMAKFPMCAACRAEYEDPGDRRFHAQPIACPECGPRVRLLDGTGNDVGAADPIVALAAALVDGKIAAIKGLGGYHLACDAGNDTAAAELRRRKHREEKPFAVMVADVDAARRWCDVSAEEAALLRSPRRPIVLLRRRDVIGVAEAVAPGNPFLGVMLPYTPIHHLLVRETNGRPLVMTSGNRSDEPISYVDDDAVARLMGIADVFLVHDRPIHVRCDDSVTRIVSGVEQPLRRSRGDAPRPIDLPFACPRRVLAVGGQLKATFALGKESHAVLSHHLGDLDHYEACKAFERDVRLYEDLFRCEPEVVAHDLHPDYASTRYCRQRGLPSIGVQHHHAHLASCMAENGLTGEAIGVCLDGAGYGSDGAIWGGEFLVGGYASFRRAGHLRYVAMPGGEQATRQPWRMALSYLRDAGQSVALLNERVAPSELKICSSLLDRGLFAPSTSSFGRLFDAVASLIGVRDAVTYEGQAAIELEWLANAEAPGVYGYQIHDGDPIVVDPRVMIGEIVAEMVRGVRRRDVAGRFHATCAAMIGDVCAKVRETSGLDRVVLSGGVFNNGLLTRLTMGRLEGLGLTAYRHRRVPAGDGGLSLGQLAVAANRST